MRYGVNMLSVIIPTYNVQDGLADILEQISPIADEVIISDCDSQDQTLNMAKRYGAKIVKGCKGRGYQLARGADFAAQNTAHQARTDGVIKPSDHYYLFLHADSRLSPQALTDISAHISESDPRAAVFTLRLDDRGFWPRHVEFWVWLRTLCLTLPYGDQGLLISRALYEQTGGYPEWNLFEDVHLIKKIGRKNLRIFKSKIITDASKYRRDGYGRRCFKNLGLIIRYGFGADPQALSKRYR